MQRIYKLCEDKDKASSSSSYTQAANEVPPLMGTSKVLAEFIPSPLPPHKIVYKLYNLSTDSQEVHGRKLNRLFSLELIRLMVHLV